MADRSYTEFLSDIRSAIGSYGSFARAVEEIYIEALNNNELEVAVGNESSVYPLGTALNYFVRFLVKPEDDGFRRTELPNLTPKLGGELLEELKEFTPDLLSFDPNNASTRAPAISALKSILELYEKYYQETTSQKAAGDIEQEITNAANSLQSSLVALQKKTTDALKPLTQPHLKKEKAELEEVPDEDLGVETDTDDILKEKKARREARAKLLEEFRKEVREALEKDKKESQILTTPFAAALLAHLEENLDQAGGEKIDAVAAQLLTELYRKSPPADTRSVGAYLWAQDRIQEIIPLFNTFLERIAQTYEKLQDRFAQQLEKIAPTQPSAPPIVEGASADDQEEPEEEEAKVVTEENFDSAEAREERQEVVTRWTEAIAQIERSLTPARIADLYLELDLGREIDPPDDQNQALRKYLDQLLELIITTSEQFDAAATQAARGEEIAPELSPPSAKQLDEILERALRTQLFNAWEVVLRQEEPESEPGNVPLGAIADAQRLQQEQATAQQVAPSEQSLSDRIQSISRAQHDILLVAEGELFLKLKTLGLPEDQIQKILADNRVLLLDTLRYKALAAASDLGKDGRLSSSQIVGLVSDEVENFYQKLIVTYSDPSSAPQLAGYFAKADQTTKQNIAQGLQQLGWSEDQIGDVLSNLEQSRFAPLLQYARSEGYLTGVAGLAQVLAKHNLVAQGQEAELARRILSGDLVALLEPALSSLPTEERKRRIKRLIALFNQAEGNLAKRSEFDREIANLLGPRATPAIMEYFARLTFADMDASLTRLQGVLNQFDGTALRGRAGLAQPLSAFTPADGAATPATQEENEYNKFMLEVALASAYERLANKGDASQGEIEVEIALIVHQFYNGDLEAGGVTARFYDDVEEGKDAINEGVNEAGTNKDDLAGAQRQSYKNRISNPSATMQNRAAQAQLAAKLLKTGGNPYAIAATLLTDKEARKLIIERLKQVAGTSLVVAGLPTILSAVIFSGVGQALSNIPIIGSTLGSLFGASAPSAPSGPAGEIAREFGRSAVSASQDAATTAKTEFARSRPGLESSAREAFSSAAQNSTQLVYNIASSSPPGWLAGAAILAPLGMATFFTIITITVIGGSLNQLPANNPFWSGRTSTLGKEACWPAEGTITTYVHPAGAGRLASGETAVDIGAAPGRPIYTPFGGRAKFLYSGSGYGNYVRIATDKGFDIILGHMSGFANARVGDVVTVQSGQQVGFIGSTGNSTGPHVHYGVLPQAGRGTAPPIYDVIPPVYPPTSLTPAAIQTQIARGTQTYYARFADCTAAPTGGTTGAGTTTPDGNNGTVAPPATAPSQEDLNNILNPGSGTNTNGPTVAPPATAPSQEDLDAILNLGSGGN